MSENVFYLTELIRNHKNKQAGYT